MTEFDHHDTLEEALKKLNLPITDEQFQQLTKVVANLCLDNFDDAYDRGVEYGVQNSQPIG